MTPQRQILGFAIGLMVCCLAGIGFIVAQQRARLSDTEHRISQAHALLNAVDSLHEELRDAELSHRSYLVSGDAADLETFRTTVVSLEQRLRTIESALADQPEKLAKLATSRGVAARYRELLEEAIGLGDSERTAVARQLLSSTREWAPVKQAGALLSDIGADARRLLETRRHQLLADAWTMQQLVFLSLALTGFGGLLVTMQVRREVRLRRESEEQVRKALLRVDQRVRERTQALSDVNRRLERVLDDRAEALSREQLARTAAERANELKDRFLATVSHELRTPLNAVVGWIHVLRSGALPPHEMQRAIDGIDRNVRAQVRLIDDLLDVSHMAQGQLILSRRSIELGPVVESAVAEMRPAIEAKGVRLGYHGPAAPIRMHGDLRRLHQVVRHLLVNAMKFTPHGGEIDVSLAVENGAAALRVRDTGEGIEAAALPHLFDPFFQAPTQAMRSGLGLGLALVKELVERHGGAVSASSPGPRAGAEFTIRLPLAAGENQEQSPQASAHPRDAARVSGVQKGIWQRLRRRRQQPT